MTHKNIDFGFQCLASIMTERKIQVPWKARYFFGS